MRPALGVLQGWLPGPPAPPGVTDNPHFTAPHPTPTPYPHHPAPPHPTAPPHCPTHCPHPPTPHFTALTPYPHSDPPMYPLYDDDNARRGGTIAPYMVIWSVHCSNPLMQFYSCWNLFLYSRLNIAVPSTRGNNIVLFNFVIISIDARS